MFTLYKKLFSLKRRIWLSKTTLFLACVGLSYSITCCLLFLYCHYARNFRSGNLTWAIAFMWSWWFCSIIIRHHSRYLSKLKVRLLRRIIFWSGVFSVYTKLYMLTIILFHIDDFQLYTEYCGDWFFWLFMIYMSWGLIFHDPNYAEVYARINSNDKKRKK